MTVLAIARRAAADLAVRHPRRTRTRSSWPTGWPGSCWSRSSSTASARWPRRSSTPAACSGRRPGRRCSTTSWSSPPALLFIARQRPRRPRRRSTISAGQVWLLGHRHHARHRRRRPWCCCPLLRQAGVPLRPALGAARHRAARGRHARPLGDRLRRGQPGRRRRRQPGRQRRRRDGGLGSSAVRQREPAVPDALRDHRRRAADRAAAADEPGRRPARRGRRGRRPLAGHPAVGARACCRSPRCSSCSARRWASSPSAAATPTRRRGRRRSATALAVGAFGLLPMAVTLLQLRVFYAMKDARTPTLIQVGMVAVRVPLLLLVPGRSSSPEHVVAGLMLATSVTYVGGLGRRRPRAAPPARRPAPPRDVRAGRADAAGVGRRGGAGLARGPD